MAAVDRNLLYGVLAVQLGFVTRDQLIAATSRWVLNKEQPLGEVFIRQGMISSGRRTGHRRSCRRSNSNAMARVPDKVWNRWRPLASYGRRSSISAIPRLNSVVEFETIGSVAERSLLDDCLLLERLSANRRIVTRSCESIRRVALAACRLRSMRSSIARSP